MKNFWKKPLPTKKINKKKLIIMIVIVAIIATIITIAAIYINNRDARNWIDINIFRKQKIQNNLPSIEIEDGNNADICAFNKYIGILSKNIFTIYDETGSKSKELTVDISKPIFTSNNKYLVIAENNGKKVYLIEDKEILWDRDIEGNIEQVTINKNGYVAVTIVDTSYKTVIQLFDNQGNSLFKRFLATTRAVATSISDDNKYLAIAQVDTSGTKVQSNIQVMSIDEAKNNNENAKQKEYSAEEGELITNIKFQEKNKLLCMYTDKIKVIKTDETEETLQEFKDKKISFATINLSNASATIEEKSSGIFTADTVVNIMNSENKNISLYNADAISKEIFTSGSIIALNMGSEVDFVNQGGWLVKKYMAEQEISKLVMSESIAGIIYRDKIEIITL